MQSDYTSNVSASVFKNTLSWVTMPSAATNRRRETVVGVTPIALATSFLLLVDAPMETPQLADPLWLGARWKKDVVSVLRCGHVDCAGTWVASSHVDSGLLCRGRPVTAFCSCVCCRVHRYHCCGCYCCGGHWCCYCCQWHCLCLELSGGEHCACSSDSTLQVHVTER